jgi:hypothetical protein
VAGPVRLIWHGLLVHKLIEEAAEMGAEIAAEKTLKDANQHVPYETGELQESGAVNADGTTAFVSYDTPYAVRLHEHPEYNFQGKGEGKWLEKAVQRRAATANLDMAPPLVAVLRKDLPV